MQKVWMKLLVVGLILIGMPAASIGATVIYGFDYVISGTAPAGSPPWATLNIEDYAANEVKFTLQANLQGSNEFFGYLLLNIEPFVSVSLVSGSVSGGSTFTSSDLTVDKDGIADAGSSYDLKIKYPTANTPDRLTNSENLTWRLSGNGLTASHFLAKSVPPKAEQPAKHYALLHTQGLAQGESGKLGASVIPEPGALLLFGMGLAAPLGILRRKR